MFDTSIKGLNKAKKKLDALELATNTQDVLDAAGAFILFKIKERFLRQEAPDGSKWEESEAARIRKAKGIDGGTLFDTGTLFHSLELGRRGAARRIFTNVEYAPNLQFGREGQPPRVFLGFNTQDIKGVERIIEARIRQALK